MNSNTAALDTSSKPIAVLDCGSQLTDVLVQRVRALGFAVTEFGADNLPTPEDLKKNFGALIISGSGDSVDRDGAPTLDKAILNGGFPTLGICYGMQLIAYLAGGTIDTGKREEGVLKIEFSEGYHPLFNDISSPNEIQLTHGDSVTTLPAGYEELARSSNGIISVMAHEHFPIVGIQGHPEAYTSPNGMVMIDNFLQKVAKLIPGTPETTEELTERLISEIRETVGEKQVLTFVSGGVDSTVCLALLKKALRPEQIFPVFIDNGFMRQGEVEQVRKDLKDATGLEIHVIDAQEEFLNATTIIDGQETPKLRDVTDPEVKRMIIGDAFMHVRDTVSARLELRDDFLLAQGTLSTDVKESGATDAGGNAKKIKTHHNRSQEVVKLLAEKRIIEPLVTQMKDGVRSIGRELGLGENMIVRNPFPGPGIAIRIICAAEPNTEDFKKLSPQIQEVMNNTGIQATILPVKAVGIAGDERVYGNLVTLSGDKNPNWEELTKIREELTRIHGVCRVMYAFGSRIDATEVHDITPTYLSTETADQVRHADKIVHDEFEKAGLVGYISQTPVASIPVGFGVDGNRSIVIRPFKTVNFKTGDAIMPGTEHMPESVLNTIVSRITAEVPEISRVLYDITPKPPGTTELE